MVFSPTREERIIKYIQDNIEPGYQIIPQDIAKDLNIHIKAVVYFLKMHAERVGGHHGMWVRV